MGVGPPLAFGSPMASRAVRLGRLGPDLPIRLPAAIASDCPDDRRYARFGLLVALALGGCADPGPKADFESPDSADRIAALQHAGAAPVVLSANGHFRAGPSALPAIRYLYSDPTQGDVQLSAEAFAQQFAHRNDPQRIQLDTGD